MLVAKQDFKRVGNLFFIGATTDVEKVRGIATGKLDDVHGSHGESSAVHHATDIAVQLDVVETVLRGFDFERIFFGDVAQIAKIRMPEERVVVEVDLGIEREDATIAGSDQRIDFDERSVGLDVSLVKSEQDLDGVSGFLRAESEPERDFVGLKRLKSDTGIDVLLEKFLGSLSGDL